MGSLYQSLIVTAAGVNPKSNSERCTGPGPGMNSQAKKKNQRAIWNESEYQGSDAASRVERVEQMFSSLPST